MTTRLFGLLKCPRCGTAPDPGHARCPGCGRSVIAAGGGLDLLDDQGREEADRFAAQYTALRRKEGWIGPDGREDPEGGQPRLWHGRLESVSRAAAALSSHRSGAGHAVVVDIGSGDGWAARYFRDAAVIAIDLLDTDGRPDGLHLRPHIRRLPLPTSTAALSFYAASLPSPPL